MADQVQLRGGSTSQNNGFTGAPRELSVDTTKNTVRVHDGATAGGHELAKSAEVLPLTGGTLTGDLTVPSLNGGQLSGFRNVLINGDLVINQRGADITSVSTGEYGQDRWKKTAGGMTQIVEAGSFEPGATYTLSGTGVTTQQLTAPASGNWTLPDISVTARKIQLEIGTVATPFERRPIGVELPLCQRYYYNFNIAYKHDQLNYGAGYRINHPVPMRTTPTIIIGGAQRWTDPVNGISTGVPFTNNFDAGSKSFNEADPTGFYFKFNKTNQGALEVIEYQENYSANAEL